MTYSDDLEAIRQSLGPLYNSTSDGELQTLAILRLVEEIASLRALIERLASEN